MKQIKKILYTTDLSKSSVVVFEQTVVLAAQTGAAIVILHVIEDRSSSSQDRLVHLVDREQYEKIRKENEDKLKSVLIGKRKGILAIQNALQQLCEDTHEKMGSIEKSVQIDTIDVQYGNPARIIVETARLHRCDMVAMGYHKKGSILKSLTGGSAKQIIKQSQWPIFLVPINEE